MKNKKDGRKTCFGGGASVVRKSRIIIIKPAENGMKRVWRKKERDRSHQHYCIVQETLECKAKRVKKMTLIEK